MNRRSIIFGAGALPLVGLTSCQGTDSSDVAAAAQDVAAIASAFQGILPVLGRTTGIPADVLTEVAGYVGDIQQLAAAIAGATTAAAAKPIVQQVEGYVNDVISVLVVMPLPPPVPEILQAAAILLPVLEAAVGMIVVKPASSRRPTATQARATLRRYAAKR